MASMSQWVVLCSTVARDHLDNVARKLEQIARDPPLRMPFTLANSVRVTEVFAFLGYEPNTWIQDERASVFPR